jgi:hypothetical protein
VVAVQVGDEVLLRGTVTELLAGAAVVNVGVNLSTSSVGLRRPGDASRRGCSVHPSFDRGCVRCQAQPDDRGEPVSPTHAKLLSSALPDLPLRRSIARAVHQALCGNEVCLYGRSLPPELEDLASLAWAERQQRARVRVELLACPHATVAENAAAQVCGERGSL